MNDLPEPKDPKQDPALRNYLLLCLTALVVILLVLVRIGIRGPSLLVPLIGVLGLSMRRPAGSPVHSDHSGRRTVLERAAALFPNFGVADRPPV